MSRDFRALDPETGLRADWLGNDAATFASEIGTNRCRSLHSNHTAGHIWAQFGSETLRARTPDPSMREAPRGGRRHYSNISMLSLLVPAPFLPNNDVGPEISGKPHNQENAY